MKDIFIQMLRSIHREGMENVISWLESSDFYIAPASSSFHCNYEGGLLEHSMKVATLANDLCEVMVKHNPEIGDHVSRDSIIVVGLLHDICKANVYKKQTKFRKDKNNQWETYESYMTDYTELPLGHGEKSVIRLLQLGLRLTDAEIMAIRWHMSAWELPMQSFEAKGNIGAAQEQYPLVTILQAADVLSTANLEKSRL